MASTFKIRGHQTEGSIHLKLLGDLDRSSALELIQMLKKSNSARHRVFIHTAGLESANPTACGILRSNLPSLVKLSDLTITGRYAASVAPDRSLLT